MAADKKPLAARLIVTKPAHRVLVEQATRNAQAPDEREEVLMARSGGRVNNDSGKVSKGRMPKGHIDPWGEPVTFKDGPLRIFRKRGQ